MLLHLIMLRYLHWTLRGGGSGGWNMTTLTRWGFALSNNHVSKDLYCCADNTSPFIEFQSISSSCTGFDHCVVVYACGGYTALAKGWVNDRKK